MNGNITSIQKFSLHDGPGIRTTVFMKGCPLACAWCQNPETIAPEPEVMYHAADCLNCLKCAEVCPAKCFSPDNPDRFDSRECTRCGQCIAACPAQALRWSSTAMSVPTVLAEVLKDRAFYESSGGGLTLSGGEPLQQAAFCLELVSGAKAAGLHVAIDTSGQVSADSLEQVLPFVDLFLYDLKLFDREAHLKYTGSSNDLVLSNFTRLCRTGKEIIVRVPQVPGITDLDRNLEQIKAFVGAQRPGIKIELVPFNILMKAKYQMLGKEIMGGDKNGKR